MLMYFYLINIFPMLTDNLIEARKLDSLEYKTPYEIYYENKNINLAQ